MTTAVEELELKFEDLHVTAKEQPDPTVPVFAVGAVPLSPTVAANWLGWGCKTAPAELFRTGLQGGLDQSYQGTRVTVYRPPVDEQNFYALAGALVEESYFFELRTARLYALDAACLWDTPARVWVVGEIVARLFFLTDRYGVTEPVVVQQAHKRFATKAYPRGRGGAAGHADQPDLQQPLADRLREFARAPRKCRVPLPDREPAAEMALVRAIDLLRERGDMVEASLVAQVALSCPVFGYRVAEVLPAGHIPPWPGFGDAMLQWLLSEENAGRFPHCFTAQDLVNLRVPHFVTSAEVGARRLDYLVGGILSKLDLSRTQLTGSLVCAAFCETLVERDLFRGNFTEYVRSRYPTVVVKPAGGAEGRKKYLHYLEQRCGRAGTTAVQGENTSQEQSGWLLQGTDRVLLAPPGSEQPLELELHYGADVDLAIAVNTRAEYLDWVSKHLATIRERWPAAECEIEPTKDFARVVCRGNWNFRAVEMYRVDNAELHYTSHHVGMVRGVFDHKGFNTRAPSFVWSVAHLASPTYNYFASRKQDPQAVLGKYWYRGFDTTSSLPPELAVDVRTCSTWPRGEFCPGLLPPPPELRL